MWNYAAGPSGFNRPPTWGTDRTSYYWGATRSVHLVVIVPGASCGPGNGLGTVSPIHTGGTIWASVFEDPLDWDQVLFHEFGHNIGLGHSNVTTCPAPKVEAAATDTSCAAVVYADYYDVMGGGYGINDLTNQRNVAALNVTHKTHLDALPRGSALRVVTAAAGATQRYTIAPASAASGVRGLEITDPLGTGKLYVEYRSGTGRDAESFYTKVSSGTGGDPRFAPGVRVLRIDCALPATCDGAGSRVLQRWMSLTSAALSHPSGTEFSSYKTNASGAGVRVSVVSTSAAGAIVDISFDSQLPAFTTKGTVRVSGTPSYFRELTATIGTPWAPTPTALAYQWLRGGGPIPGATSATYRVADADLGTSLSVRVTATAAGRAPSVATSAAVAVPVTYPTAAISGTVRLPAGTPTGARTEMTVVAHAAPGGPFRPTVSADVDAAAGTYRITGLAPGDWRLQVVPRGADGSTPGADVAAQWYGGAPNEGSSRPVLLGGDVAGVDFALTRSLRISGTVSLPAGAASSLRTAVSVTAEHVPADGDRSAARAATAPVDATTGAYTLTGLDPADYRLQFVVTDPEGGARVPLASEWYRGAFRESDATALVLRGDLAGVNTTLTPTRTISGAVTLPAGAPTTWRSYLRVVVTGADGAQEVGQVDPAGAFAVPYLAPGPYAVCLRVDDEEWDSAAGAFVHRTTLIASCFGGAYTADRSTPVDTAGGNVAGVQLAAVHGRALSGTVSLPTGTPASYREDTIVEAIPIDARGELEQGTGTSVRVDDTTGRYRIGNLIPGRYVVRVSPQSSVWDPVTGTSTPTQLAPTWYGGSATAAGASTVDVSASDVSTVNVALVRATASLSGTIDSTALRGATGTAVSLVLSLVDAAGTEVVQTSWADGGAYTFTGLLPGSYRVLMLATIRRGTTTYEHSTQYLKRADGSGVVTVAANAQVTGAVLTAAAASASIRGSLTTAGFAEEFVFGPLAEARLYVRDGSTWVGFPDSLASAYTDETRTFTSSLLAAGSYTVGYEGLPAAFRIAGSSLVQEWWQDRTSLATADAVALAAGATRLGMHGAVHPAGVTPPVVVDPVLTWKAPTVVGIPKVGAPLLVSIGRWTPGVTFAYQWSVGGVAVSGATTANFTPRTADVGKTVTVRVTGRKDGYAPVVTTSAPSAAVLPAAMTAPIPTISGTAKAGLTLTAKPGTWTTGVTFSYQWYVAGAAVSGATKATFIPRTVDIGKTATVRVTGSHPAYTPVARTSRATATIATYSRLTVGTPTIAGTPKAGLTLTARPGTWTSGTVFSYQWYVAGVAVSGATKVTFVPGGGHVGKTVTVKVTGRKAGYLTASKVSRATAKVAAYSRLTVGTPTIAGTPKVGLTLTARPGSWTTGTTFYYQWYVAGVAVSGATRTTFVPRAGDVGKVVTVKVTGRKAGYLTASKVSAATARVAA